MVSLWKCRSRGSAGNRAGPWKVLAACDAAAPRAFSSCLGSDFVLSGNKILQNHSNFHYLPRNQEFLWEIFLKSGFRDNDLERAIYAQEPA